MAFWETGAMQVCSLSLELAVRLYSHNRAICKACRPYSCLHKRQVVPLYLMAVAQLGGRSEETQMAWYLFLLLQRFGVHFTMRYQAAANLTQLISLLFWGTVVTLSDIKPCQLQTRSLLLTFEHFTNNIVNVRCYVLNQTTVVPKYYVHMTNVRVTFCYTDSFIGKQTYAPMLNYVCICKIHKR